MARYLLHSGVDRFKGSLGGATFQQSGKVFAIRKRAVPIQKRTAAQSAVKNQFDFVQKNWKNLTAGQQTSFDDETINFLRTDSLGNSYELRASQLQASSNINLISRNQGPISTMSSPVVYPNQFSNTIAIVPSISSADIFCDPVIIPVDFTLSKFCSAPLSANSSVPSIATMKFMSVIQSGASQISNDYQNYIDIWGDVSNKIGSMVWCAFIMNSTLNGQSNEAFFDFGFIEP